MSYPSTTLSRPLPPITPDPIEDAKRLLRAAARLPYSASAPNTWLRRFRLHVVDARRALAVHVMRGERSDSDVNTFVTDNPRLIPQVQRQADEHMELMRLAHELVSETETIDAPDLWRMVNLSEETMALAQMVEKHHRRLVDIAYEATNRDIGGPG